MRAGPLILLLCAVIPGGACRPVKTANPSVATPDFATLSFASTAKKPDFETRIRPIFQTRCQPCHFPGGKVYEKMPFDKPETIARLGEKLFTRIKDKDEQRLIREFLSQP